MFYKVTKFKRIPFLITFKRTPFLITPFLCPTVECLCIVCTEREI